MFNSSYGLSRSARNDILENFVIVRRLWNVCFCHCEEATVDVAIVYIRGFVVSFVLFVYSSYGLSRSARNDRVRSVHLVIARRLQSTWQWLFILGVLLQKFFVIVVLRLLLCSYALVYNKALSFVISN